MRILLINNYYPPHEVGGYGQLCRDVAVRLQSRGHTVAVLTSDRGVEGNRTSGERDIHRLLRIQPHYANGLSPAAQFWLTRRRIERYNRDTCLAIVADFDPDVVFLWNLDGLPHELALDLEATSRVAVAYWLASYSPAEPDAFWRYWLQPPGTRTLLSGFKSALSRVAFAHMRREGKPVRPQMPHVAVVSDYMRRRGLTQGTLPDHTEVIYNGVEVDEFYHPVSPPETPPPMRLLLAGRVSADKGVHIAVEAVGLAARAQSQRNFQLIVAGTGPEGYLRHLQQLAARYSCSDRISYLGWLPRDRMPSLMHSCHILLLPTVHQEPFARVTLEAMAAGLAVIGTLTGGTAELLQDGVNGLVCVPDDGQDLADQIGRLLSNPQLRYRLASRGQEMVLEQYTLTRMVDRIEEFLERAIAEPGQ